MSFTKFFAVLLISLFYYTTNYAQSRADLWGKDISYLKTELSSRHKNLFFKTDQSTFNLKLDSIINEVDNLSDIEVSIALLEVLALMGDDHTSIYIPKLNNDGLFPLKFYWFSDGLYVINTIIEYENLLWGRIIAINQIPINDVNKRLSNLTAKTNDAIIKTNVPIYIQFVSVLKHYKIIEGDSALITYENITGETQQLMVKSFTPSKDLRLNMTVKQFDQKALCETNRRSLFWSQYLDDEKVLYAQYNQCYSKEFAKMRGERKKAKNLPSFKKFSAELIKLLNNEEIDKFIFDMRYNPGGYSNQGTRLIKK